MSLPSFCTMGRGTYYANIIAHRWGNETITIGNYTSIAQEVRLLAGGGHKRDVVSTFPFDVLMGGHATASDQDRCYEHGKGIFIGSDVHLGFGSTVIGHVSIGHGAVIASNATVFGDVPSYAIYGGNPARLLRFRFEPEVVDALLRIAWWDWPESRIKSRMDDFYIPIAEFVARYDVDCPIGRMPVCA